jgi:NAD(P)-dependent dehydrogenase (short-subunit alcohol dehydrogenase family)
MRLRDKVAVITGGGGGIGRATCRLFAREGARVLIADLIVEEASKVADELTAQGHQALALQVDITDLDQARRMADAALDEFGQIDILANIAGGSAGPAIKTKHGLFAESTNERWQDMIHLNLFGTFNCTRVVIDHMIERRSGKIVSFASTAGTVGMQKATEYSAAKGGIIAFSKALAKEVAEYGINVNCISPGIIGSPRVRAMNKEMVRQWEEGIPLGRLGRPDEVASVVLFLSSDESSYITGENITVAGGLSLGPKGY